MFLSQRKYAIEILDRAHMVNCNLSQTPVDTKSKLGDDCDPVSDPTLYRSLAGSLQYLTITHPYISYAVHQVCLYTHDPREPYFLALKQILRYVCDTLDHGLSLFSSSTTSLVACSYTNWDGCPTTRAEVEYHGVVNAVYETCWLRNLLHEFHTPLSYSMLVYCDNGSPIYLSANVVRHQRTKHLEIDIHFVRDLVVVCQGCVGCEPTSILGIWFLSSPNRVPHSRRGLARSGSFMIAHVGRSGTLVGQGSAYNRVLRIWACLAVFRLTCGSVLWKPSVRLVSSGPPGGLLHVLYVITQDQKNNDELQDARNELIK
ncbi:ribonuclease H-like domain-containing protein, partial [Tanacetum coccineum]